MTKKEVCTINKPIATMGLTNTSGVAIHAIEYGTDDFVYASYVGGDYISYHKCKLYSKIYADGRDSTYFYIGKMKLDLNDFLKTGF